MSPFGRWWKRYAKDRLPDQLPRRREIAGDAWDAAVEYVSHRIGDLFDEAIEDGLLAKDVMDQMLARLEET